MAPSFMPDGYHTATPYLTVNDASGAIEFYKKAFDAAELMRIGDPGEKVGHAEIKIGDSIIMLADEFPEWGNRSPQSLGGSPVVGEKAALLAAVLVRVEWLVAELFISGILYAPRLFRPTAP